MRKVIIVGTGGHAKVVADTIREAGDEVMGFLDDNSNVGIFDLPVFGKVAEYVKYIDKVEFIVAIGDPYIRSEIVEKMNGARWYTAIHPKSIISKTATIGEGTVVMAGAVVNADAIIQKHCIINTSAVVEHDNIIDDYAHISVGAKLGGAVQIGDHTWVGIGATIKNNTDVCSGCMIGAGAVVVKNITEPGTYIGVPAGRAK